MRHSLAAFSAWERELTEIAARGSFRSLTADERQERLKRVGEIEDAFEGELTRFAAHGDIAPEVLLSGAGLSSFDQTTDTIRDWLVRARIALRNPGR